MIHRSVLTKDILWKQPANGNLGSQNGSVEVPVQEQAMFGCYFCFEDRFMTSDLHLSQLEAGAPII